MLVALLNIPKTDNEWNTWAYHHRLSHDAIRRAVLIQRNISLNEYQIEPIDLDDTSRFLQNNQQSHVEMAAALGVESEDLQDVDLEDDAQKIAWIDAHWLEHSTAELALGI